MRQFRRLLTLAGSRTVRLSAVGLIWLAMARQASGVVVLIDFLDRNGVGGFPNDGGPHWTGRVDTATDTLTIESWVDLNGTPLFWTPAVSTLPLIWSALTFDGIPYDVPDTFDGHIDSSFAFISPVSAMNMVWNQGTWGTNGVLSFPEADFFPGWGGVRRPQQGGGGLLYDLSANETEMPMLPIATFGVAAATGATVTATPLASVGAVPEAPAFLLGGIIAASAAGWAGVRRIARLW
jgi:hypothetical protein